MLRTAARIVLLALPATIAFSAAITAITSVAARLGEPAVAALLPAVSATAAADQYIVVLKAKATHVNAASIRQQVRQQAVTAGAAIQFDYAKAINGFAAQLSTSAVEALRRNPDVAYIQPNLIHQQASGAVGSIGIDTVQPNAPWHLDRIDQRNLPLNSQYNYTNDGAGVHAYIIDSGIRSTHVEFEGRVVKDFTSINDGNGTEDCANHGTFVASEVAGKTYGVAKKVTLHAVRILTCGNSGTTAQIVAGMDWVAANHLNPNVANMSIQSANGATDTAMDQAAAGMIDAGVNLVLIAGNFNNSNCTNSPKDPRALITAATTTSDSRNTGSNPSSYGSCVDIWAPGAGLTGAGRASDTAVLTNWSGTSMAAPLVTGTIAMALQSHPNLTMQQAYNLIVNNATTGVLSNIGNSPNRLLYSLGLDPGQPPTSPPPSSAPPTSPPTSPPPSSPPPPGSTRYEAENGVVGGGATIASTFQGFTGTGYCTNLNATSTSIEFTVNVPASGNYTIITRYSSVGNSTMSISVNNTRRIDTTLANTGSNTAWSTKVNTLSLPAGTVRIKFRNEYGAGTVPGNIDHIVVAPA